MQQRLWQGLYWASIVALLIATGCASGGGATPDATGTAAKQAMIDRHNASRITYGVPTFGTNQLLMQIAQNQADYIAQIGDPVHQDAAGGHVNDRATAIGYAWTHIGENVAFAIDAGTVYDMWLGSPSHLANITDDAYSEIGVGVALRGRYQYWCIVFGAR